MSGLRRTLSAVVVLSLSMVIGSAQVPRKSGSPTGNPFMEKARRFAVATKEVKARFLEDVERAGKQAAGSIKSPPPASRTFVHVIQQAELQRLRTVNGGPVHIVMDEAVTVPIFIAGENLLSVAARQPVKITQEEKERRALSFLSENRRLLMIGDPEREFLRTEATMDRLGTTHFRYQQIYRGLEIWGRDVRVHLTKDGRVESFNGRMIPSPTEVMRQQTLLSEREAVRIAREATSAQGGSATVRTIIYPGDKGASRICWLVNTKGGLDENWMTFVDVETGEVHRSFNNIYTDGPVTGSGTDLRGQTRQLQLYQVGSDFYMIDASKQMFSAGQSTMPGEGKGVIYTLDAQNGDGASLFYVTSGNAASWSNASAVSAAANGSKVYDYYLSVHNRNAVDGKGTTMSMVVKYKTGLNNAFWTGTQMVFGTGDGSFFGDLAAAIDVTAHEMTHGVIQETANLVYENQPGALNESFADVFGALAEFWIEPAKTDWWMIGEDVITPSTSGDALRRMDDPGHTTVAGSKQPSHMNQYQNLPNTEDGDHGGVHINSGIPNHAFYLFATSAGVTLDDAAQVYYRAVSVYLTRNAQFVDCRLAVIKSAEDLFGGPGNAKALAAAAAFDAVGIGDGASTPPPPTQPPVSGTDYLAVIEASSALLYRSTTDGSAVTQMSTTPLRSRPSVTDDGSLIFYVDQSTNLHLVHSDGSNDQTLTTSGGFNNISISPDGRYLAATSTFEEPVMYVFDLDNGGTLHTFTLYTPTYSEGVTAGSILYPDRIDWTSDSQVLMYDALNQTKIASGDSTQYWDINLLRVTDGVIARLFPPQPPGVDIGNAVFASNSDNIIAFDYVEEGDSVRVLAVDLNTGTIGQVTNNWFSLGSPTFSANDRQIFYHYMDQSNSVVYVVDLAQDGLTGLGNDQILLTGAAFPVSFTIGTRPTGVPEDGSSLPASFGLDHNYPNPFNPSTTIDYRLDHEGDVRIRVFDLLGREVARLIDAHQSEGKHTTTFDAGSLPTGVYMILLESGGKRSIRRASLIR